VAVADRPAEEVTAGDDVATVLVWQLDRSRPAWAG
jgi:hypothetical protein